MCEEYYLLVLKLNWSELILLAVKKCKIDLPDIYKGLKAKAMKFHHVWI